LYRELLEAWMRERDGEDLQPLPKDFYKRLSLYFRRRVESSRIVDPRSVSARLIQAEMKNALRLFTKLYELRLRKVMSMVFKALEIPRSNLTEEEAELLNYIEAFKEARDRLAETIAEGREPKVAPLRSRKMTLVRFLKESPAIVGVDLKSYGPFKPEDVAYLPKENAEVLEKRGVVVRIDAEN